MIERMNAALTRVIADWRMRGDAADSNAAPKRIIAVMIDPRITGMWP